MACLFSMAMYFDILCSCFHSMWFLRTLQVGGCGFNKCEQDSGKMHQYLILMSLVVH